MARRWKLKEVPNLARDHAALGWCFPSVRKILIDPDQPREQYIATLVHEILHGGMPGGRKRPVWLTHDREEELVRAMELPVTLALADLGFKPPARRKRRPARAAAAASSLRKRQKRQG